MHTEAPRLVYKYAWHVWAKRPGAERSETAWCFETSSEVVQEGESNDRLQARGDYVTPPIWG